MAQITPQKAIRRKCLECTGWNNPIEVKNCNSPNCPLYPLKMGRRKKGTSPLRQIRKHCLECMGGSSSQVKDCVSVSCPIHCYRSGHNPKRKGIGGNSIIRKIPELCF